MDFLRSLLGNLTSGIIRLAVTAGILVLVYLLIVKPVLHTTDKAINNAGQSIQKSVGVNGLDEVGKALEGVSNQVQRQIRRSLNGTRGTTNPKKLIRCIKRAHGNTARIRRCARRY